MVSHFKVLKSTLCISSGVHGFVQFYAALGIFTYVCPNVALYTWCYRVPTTCLRSEHCTEGVCVWTGDTVFYSFQFSHPHCFSTTKIILLQDEMFLLARLSPPPRHRFPPPPPASPCHTTEQGPHWPTVRDTPAIHPKKERHLLPF